MLTVMVPTFLGGAMTLNINQQDARMSSGQLRLQRSVEMAPGGDVKSARISMSLKTLVTKKGQLSESISSSSC
ncbi:Uncharacterized protein HZ326_18730 [Fusarium oxysporum f. sp. albedinis]|nr:Uncharacterized protein HZ326_18730 [Fusarium oxysporum f. sp. albedinis]